jgi:hypothetical protein
MMILSGRIIWGREGGGIQRLGKGTRAGLRAGLGVR